MEPENMSYADLEELVKQHDLQQPSEEERRAVRTFHSEIRENLLGQQEDISMDALQNTLESIETTFAKVKNTREAVKDAENIRLVSEIQRRKIQAYDPNLIRFVPTEFAENLKRYCVDTLQCQGGVGALSANSWSVLGLECHKLYRKSPALHFMCGAFERGEVVRKVARERKRRETEPTKTTQLKQLDSFKDTAKNEATTAEVEDVLKTLWGHYKNNNRSPICYFEFITNPHSFGQTVENMFYVSFLAKDGYINMELDEDGLPVIEPVEGADQNNQQGNDGSGVRNQIVMSITPKQWKEIVEAFKIKEPLIKNRPGKTK